MSKIYVVMGKSATGKDTIYKRLVEDSHLNLQTVVGYTTRPIRQGELDGVEYFFVTDERRQELDKLDKIIEHRVYQTIYGEWHYFTVDDGQIALDTKNYIMIGTLEAYQEIQSYYGKGAVVPIYIEVEDGLRLRRAINRESKQSEPKYAELCRRFLADEEDFSEENIRALGIEKRYQNIDINICLQEIIDDLFGDE